MVKLIKFDKIQCVIDNDCGEKFDWKQNKLFGSFSCVIWNIENTGEHCEIKHI